MAPTSPSMRLADTERLVGPGMQSGRHLVKHLQDAYIALKKTRWIQRPLRTRYLKGKYQVYMP
jgi:hypothetical protein